jgi:hypothetical protein
MYGHVAAHVWSPPNFPHSEDEAKHLRTIPAQVEIDPFRSILNARPSAHVRDKDAPPL